MKVLAIDSLMAFPDWYGSDAIAWAMFCLDEMLFCGSC